MLWLGYRLVDLQTKGSSFSSDLLRLCCSLFICLQLSLVLSQAELVLKLVYDERYMYNGGVVWRIIILYIYKFSGANVNDS